MFLIKLSFLQTVKNFIKRIKKKETEKNPKKRNLFVQTKQTWSKSPMKREINLNVYALKWRLNEVFDGWDILQVLHMLVKVSSWKSVTLFERNYLHFENLQCFHAWTILMVNGVEQLKHVLS